MSLKPLYYISYKPARLFKYHLYKIHYVFEVPIWYSRLERSDRNDNIVEYMQDHIHGRLGTERWYDAAGALMLQLN